MNNGFKVNITTKEIIEIERAKIMAACAHFERAFNSEEFKQFILNFSYKNTYTTGRLWNKKTHTEIVNHFESTEMTNEQVYRTLMNGAETLSPEIDHEADIYLEIDRRDKHGVIGYTYPRTKWQYMYNWFFKSVTIEEIAGNLLHEYCHKLGFDHAYYNTPTRQYSVPYACGYFITKFR